VQHLNGSGVVKRSGGKEMSVVLRGRHKFDVT
jgi:hypothetical protein